MVEIYLNGEKKNISAGTNLESLLEIFSLPRERIAIELNREVVRKKDWEKTTLREKDKIEIVHFVGGG